MAERVRTRGEPSGSFLVAAATYVALGLTPIPLRGKRPAINWKPLQGRRLVDGDWDEADRYLASWWDRPDPYNIGVLTGAEIYVGKDETAHLIVLDADDEAALELVGDHDTPTVETSKGAHFWFAHSEPVGNRTKVGGVGLDVRGAGGFVVAPPSVHPSGHVYRWTHSGWIRMSAFRRDGLINWPPKPVPEHLRELLWPARKVRPSGAAPTIYTDKYVQAALEREVEAVASAPEGTRNHQLNRSAFAISRFVRTGRLSAVTVVDAFVAAAARAGLPDREAERTLESALSDVL